MANNIEMMVSYNGR